MAANCDKAQAAERLSHNARLQYTGIKVANHMQAHTKIKAVSRETDTKAQKRETHCRACPDWSHTLTAAATP